MFQPAKKAFGVIYVRQRWKKIVFAISPFALGQNYLTVRGKISTCLHVNILCCTDWFKHEFPDLVKMTGEEFINQYCGPVELDHKGFGTVVRIMWEFMWMTGEDRRCWTHILLPIWAYFSWITLIIWMLGRWSHVLSRDMICNDVG